MAWSTAGKSGLFVYQMTQAMNGGTAVNMTLTTHRLALFKDAVTPDYSAATAALSSYTGASSVWSTANENTTGTGYTQGGILFSAGNAGAAMTPSFSDSPAGTIKYAMSANFSVTTMTLAEPTLGCLLFADALTPKQGFCGIYFGSGSGYQPNNGTFTIQWSGTGVFTIDVTP